MADGKIEIEVDPVFGAQAKKKLVDDAKKTGGKAGKKAGKSFSFGFNSSIKNIAIGNILSKAVTAAAREIKDAIVESVRDLREFSRGIAEVNSILPQNSKLLESSTKQLIAFSSQFATGPAEQAKAFYNIVSAGITDTSQALAVLEQSNKAAVAGLVDIDTAAKGIISSINSYSKSGLSASKASDVLFSAVKEGRTTFGELAGTIGRVASIGSSAGVEFSDLAGTLAFVTKSGIQTDEAVIGLRGLLTSVIGPTEQVSKKAKELGINFSAAALKSKGLGGFLEDISKKTKGSVEALRALFPNVRAFNVAVKVAGGDLKDFNRILGETRESSGATGRAFATISENLDFKLAKRGQEFSNFFLAIGRSANKVFGELALNSIPTIDSLTKSFVTLGRAINLFLILPLELVGNATKVAFTGIQLAVQGIVSGITSSVAKIGKALSSIGVDGGFSQALIELGENSTPQLEAAFAEFDEAKNKIFDFSAALKGEEFIAELENVAGASQAPLNQLANNFTATGKKISKTSKAIAIDLNKQISGAITKGLSGTIQVLTQNLLKGQSLFKDFGKFIFGVLGDVAIKIGETTIAASLAISALGTLSPAAGIAAGAALIAIGSVIKGLSGGSGGISAGAGGGAGGGVASAGFAADESTLVSETDEREEPETKIAVNIQGDVLDSDETGLRIVQIIQNTFDTEGAVITQAV